LRFFMSFIQWKEQLKEEKKVKKYQHLDRSINLDLKNDFQEVVDAIKNITNHSFLPFIKRISRKTRFKHRTNKLPVRTLKLRPIMYASHLDSHVYSYFNYCLSLEYEKKLKECELSNVVLAYRSIKIPESSEGKCNIHFASEVFNYISNRGMCVVITQDIKGFFDEISHKFLFQGIKELYEGGWIDSSLVKVLHSLTAFKYINYDDFRKNHLKQLIESKKEIPIYKLIKQYVHKNKSSKGIPQGSPLSGLLANIYMLSFDMEIRREFPAVFYRRYSDDLIFICDEELKDNLLASIEEKISHRDLSIQPTKTFIAKFGYANSMLKCVQVSDGNGVKNNRDYIDFLGFEYNGQTTHFRKNTYQKLLKKSVINRISRKKNSTKLIKRIKPKKDTLKHRNRSNYLMKAIEVTKSDGMRIQLNKFNRKVKEKFKKSLCHINPNNNLKKL